MKYLITILLSMVIAAPAAAKNIDLSTVPKRDTVQLTIYNAEDLTLVRETRLVSFKRGSNPLQFSWANTLIDPTSVQLKFLTHPEKLTVLDTTFPHDKPQMLYWNVKSDVAGEARIEISYFTSGITWAADYVGIADSDETIMELEGFVTVKNNSGEDYADAQVRLVVGTINLVEKIAELARRGIIAQPKDGRARRTARKRVIRQAVAGAEMMMDAAAPAMEAPAQIIKEGLSEYFIFTIEGTQTVPDKWSKRMRSFDTAKVPIKIQYRFRQREYGNQLVKMFLLTNDEASDLGQSPLPDGVFRIFRRSGADGLSFLSTQALKYIPIGDKIELNLGHNPEVVFELVDLRAFRDQIWMKLHGVDVLHRADKPGVRLDPRSSVVGWDQHMIHVQRIGNYTGKPIDVQVRRTYGGDVTFKSELGAKAHDYQTVQFSSQIEAGKKAELRYEVISKQGRNAKQNRVTLKAAAPAVVPWRKAG